MNLNRIGAIKISLLNPQKMLSESKGEVTVAKTFDTKGNPIRDGLFCERIFGTIRPGACLCGTFHKEYKTKHITCDKCGFDVLRSWEKKARKGHIALNTPVVHIWYRSTVATLLGLPPNKIKEVINCKAFIVLKGGETNYKPLDIISSNQYFSAYNTKGFKAGTGGDVIKILLEKLDIETLEQKLRKEVPSRRVNKRLQIVRDFNKSGVRPEWMVMDVLPVLHPDMRPVLFMEDGTIASSDLNELYARVINRNNRLGILKKINSPEMLQLIERRLLQGSVDSLLNNKKGHTAKDRARKRVLKSLADIIEKKEGRMRRNLLGKRVDYSGRSVIVVGPTLKLHQVGLPITLALDMFRPFVYGNLISKGLAKDLRNASFLVDIRRAETIDALEEELRERVVILNRAPSLHRMSIQAFEPVLVEGKAIRLHPMVCAAFNADFDGDQMGVHLPISIEAQIETRVLMLSINNLFSPANGKLIMTPTQDIVLGIYYLTKDRANQKGEGMVFSDKEDALWFYYAGACELQAKIIVRINKEKVETTVGRLILSEIFPPDIPFDNINKTLRKKGIGKLIEMVYEKSGHKVAIRLLDKIKEIGFKYATKSGISFGISDITIPIEKSKIIKKTEQEVNEVKYEFANGLITETERHNKIISLWGKATEEISKKMMETLGVVNPEGLTEEEIKDRKEFNNMFIMADSGARGAVNQIAQLGGMRGLMAKTTGDVVENPIKSNLKEGLTYHEYLLASHGARKGRADGALKTANAGYFTRRLIDVSHDIIVEEKDCGTLNGITMSALIENNEVILPLEDRIYGKNAAETISNPVTGEVIVKRNELIDKKKAEEIVSAGFMEIKVRSPFSCSLTKGVCVKCYGLDLSRKKEVEIGETVGIIAAQSIGEPGTQLTLRTFHSGGSASGITANSSIEAKRNGTIEYINIQKIKNSNGRYIAITRGGRVNIISEDGKKTDMGPIPYGAMFHIEEGEKVKIGAKIISWDPYNIPIISTTSGEAKFIDIIEGKTIKKKFDHETNVETIVVTAMTNELIPKICIGEKEYTLPIGAVLNVRENDNIDKGTVIAKIPKKATKTSDITGGLSKVLQVLENRKIENSAIIAEIDGKVRVHPPKGKFIEVDIFDEFGNEVNYKIPLERQINFCNGDPIKTGDIICDGEIETEDVLKIFGVEKAALHIINEVQKVYIRQGVSINDKHFEVITRKMLGFVEVMTAGDTDLVCDDIITKDNFLKINKECVREKATAVHIVLGLAKAAINSDSWLSAASFERTTSVLSSAAIKGLVDDLSGVKENVILGKRVPVGTGHPHYLTSSPA